MSSGIPPPRPGLSTPAKKPAFRPSSVHPTTSPSANSSPIPTQITPPKSKIPTITANTRSPSNSQPPSPAHTPLASNPSQPTALLRNAPNLNKKHADKRLSGEISAARTYLHSEASLSAAAAIQSQAVSQADRRNKLKKRALIQQTEKIKELLWEKASLMQKKQLMDEEQRELDGLKRKVEEEREERQKAWVMEEAMRREEEEEELRYAVMRMRKYVQRYDFEMAKREKMIASKEAKDKKKSNYAAEVAESNRRQHEERSKLAEGIRGELDDTLPSDTLLDAPAAAARLPPTLQTSGTTAAGHPEAFSPSSADTLSPGSVASERSFSSVQPLRRPSESTTSTVSDGDVARELHATGFPAGQRVQAVAERTSAGSEKSTGEQELLELNDETIANADGILDEDDVTFVSSDDDSDDEEEKEAESSRRGSRRSSTSAQIKKAASRAEREEKEQERERDERERRAKETEMEREERERREQEDREKKEREWQELKERLMSEARELQEAERQRVQREREEEQRQVAASMAAKEAHMNELLAKLKEVEIKGVPPLPTLPDAQPIIGTSEPDVSAAVPETPMADATTARAVTTPEKSPAEPASKQLPPLSSITLRSASESLARRTAAQDEEVIDEPTQAPGAQNALPSLSSTPVRRLVAASTNAASSTSPVKKAKTKSEPSESMAISSMLHELEQLEEEEEMMLRMGLEVRKVPRMGKSKVVKMYIDKTAQDEWVVRWDSKKKNKDEASIPLNGCKVVTGMQAGLFLKPENAERFAPQRNCCFSVITADRTLDVVAMTFSDQDLWTRTLIRLAKQKKRGGTALNSPSAATTPADSAVGSRVISPVNSAPASRRSSGNVGGFVSVGMERSKNKQSSNGAEISAADPSKEIENYLSRHLKNF